MRFPSLLLAAALGLTLSACTIALQPRPYNVTVDNTRCLTPATVFIDDQNVGRIPGGGVRSFPVAPGPHSLNVDNDLAGPEVIRVGGDVTWHGGTCL